MLFKKLTMLAVASTLSAFSIAQNWQLLATDVDGDVGVPSGVQDAKSLSYAVDSIADSLWFKVQLYDTVGLDYDWGFFMGLDTDQDSTNGTQWNGHQNNSLKFDYTIEFYNNKFFPPTVNNLITHDQQLVTDSIYYRIEDDFTLVIRLPLSLVDTDTHMRLIASWGDFTGARYDDIPDTGVLETGAHASGFMHQTAKPISMRIAPNPATDRLSVTFDQNSIQRLELIDIHGQVVYSATTNGSNRFDVELGGFSSGIYLLRGVGEGEPNLQRVVIE